jgi:uncharacterized protein
VFGQVRHARLRPSAHAFVYPAFFLRVPIHAIERNAENSKKLSEPKSIWFGVNRRAVISFFEEDHGDEVGLDR